MPETVGQAVARLMIQTEALRLFGEKGYANTTIEDIADAAAISRRTFFRYFPTKEDVVIWDDYDPIATDLVEARPAGEPLAQGFRAVIRETLGGLYQRDPDRLLSRVRLIATVPEVRACYFEEQANGVEELGQLLGPHPAADELRLRVVGSALLSAVSVALELWQRDDGASDLLTLLDQATDALTESLSELSPSSRGRDA